MNTKEKKFPVRVFLFVFLATLLYAGTAQQEQSQKEQEQKSIVLKELLMPSKESFPSPKRNIFLRQRINQATAEFSTQGDFPSQGRPSGQEASPAQKKAAVEETGVNVQYIGYIQSGKRVVALIILEGQTYAVESGDVLEMGVTIGRITPEDLEISDRNSQTKRVKLEGE